MYDSDAWYKDKKTRRKLRIRVCGGIERLVKRDILRQTVMEMEGGRNADDVIW